MQSSDLDHDPRVRYRQLPAGSGLRSMLAAPLLVGDQVIGALTVLRRDVHHFTPEEESLVSAFADQAAMALEHARLFSSVRTYSEQLEAMVAARTQELDEQKRFVEVVLETLPLGLFVLDRALFVVSANREGADLLPFPAGGRTSFVDLVPASKANGIRAFLETVVSARSVRQMEEEMPSGVETRTVRLTAAPLRGPGGDSTHCLVLVEDITLRKRLERQMLLTERLTHGGPAGRWRRPRAQQSARDHRRLRRGAQGARPGPRARGTRRIQGLPVLPLAHRGGGLPLQGDHGQPAPVRPRPGQPPRPHRCQRPRGQGPGAACAISRASPGAGS